MNWTVEVHGDRVVVRPPPAEDDREEPPNEFNASDAFELAEAIREAAEKANLGTIETLLEDEKRGTERIVERKAWHLLAEVVGPEVVVQVRSDEGTITFTERVAADGAKTLAEAAEDIAQQLNAIADFARESTGFVAGPVIVYPQLGDSPIVD